MKMIKQAGIALLLGLAPLAGFAADEVVVIVNADNTQALTKSDVKAIYSDNIIQWSNGETIKSFDLPVKNEARERFSQAVLGMSAKDAAREWANRKITNTAKNPPRTKKERLVATVVSKRKNAIGYVTESVAKSRKGVKILFAVK